jgi:hypothetical protein
VASSVEICIFFHFIFSLTQINTRDTQLKFAVGIQKDFIKSCEIASDIHFYYFFEIFGFIIHDSVGKKLAGDLFLLNLIFIRDCEL